MSDNPQLSSDFRFALAFGVLALTGPDASKFAHAQFMSDVAALPVGRWHWSGWLTPKGRVIALFALLRLDPETLWLLLPDDDAGELAARLGRYVFRSKVKLQALPLGVVGAFTRASDAVGAKIGRIGDTAIELDFSGAGGARSVRISMEPAASDSNALARWKRFDLAHGLPRLDASQREQWTPQMLSLERLQAYSVKKGCYPGQEIVARTHFLGQAKRGLALFESDVAVPVGADIVEGERTLATVVSSAARNGGCVLLAVLPLEAGTSQLQSNNATLVSRPLLDGLAR